MAARPPVTGQGAASEVRNPKLPPIPLATTTSGAAPPPGAPIETAQPLKPDAGSVYITNADGTGQIISPMDLARANEQQLQPLTTTGGAPSDRGPVVAATQREVVPAGSSTPALPITPDAPPQTTATGPAGQVATTAQQPVPVLQRVKRVFGRGTAAIRDANRERHDEKQELQRVRKLEKLSNPPAVPVIEAPAAPVPPTVQDAVGAHIAQQPRPVVAAGGAGAQVMQVLTERGNQAGNRSGRPAASNTDSPSRGIPRAIDDPGKQITGGFGEGLDAQYFPLDGHELLQVVWVLMDELAQRLQNDLRFTMSTVYPRVAVKAMIQVEGYAADQTFTIEKRASDVLLDKTPVEIARLYGDEVVFVVLQERKEFNADGTISSPPNAMRQEIGAVIPRKQFVGTGSARQLVDVAPEISDGHD